MKSYLNLNANVGIARLNRNNFSYRPVSKTQVGNKIKLCGSENPVHKISVPYPLK